MTMNYYDKKVKCPFSEEIKSKETLINNLNCHILDNHLTSERRPCLPTELIKNGGFEERGIFGGEYAHWEEILDNVETLRLNIPYEGTQSAEFQSVETQEPKIKTAVLSQNVTVPPGCFLVLSFADNFLSAGEGLNNLHVRARVFYDSTNLINIETSYLALQAEKGFVFHQRVSDNPVPSNVSSVTVQFTVEMRDTEGTSWLLDGVSLRAV